MVFLFRCIFVLSQILSIQSTWIPPMTALDCQIDTEKVVVKWLSVLNNFAVSSYELDGVGDSDFPVNGHLVALFSSAVRYNNNFFRILIILCISINVRNDKC